MILQAKHTYIKLIAENFKVMKNMNYFSIAQRKQNKIISLVGLSEDSSPALITKFDLCEMENFIHQHDIIVITICDCNV